MFSLAKRPSSATFAAKPSRVGIDDAVGTEGRDDPPAPFGLDLVVMDEAVVGALGGGQDLDIEALEQSARTEFRLGQRLADGVVIEIGRGCLQPHLQPEDRREDMIEPGARGRPAEKIVILGEQFPDGAPVRRRRPARGSQAHALQADALAVEHAQDIVIGPQNRLVASSNGASVANQAGIGVAVRADDRQLLDMSEKAARNGADGFVGREKTVRMEAKCGWHDKSLEIRHGNLIKPVKPECPPLDDVACPRLAIVRS